MKNTYTAAVKKKRKECFIVFPKEMLDECNISVGDKIKVDFSDKGRLQVYVDY